jgi:hypothetical protein
MALDFGADLAIELAPLRIYHMNRTRNRFGSLLNLAIQSAMFAHIHISEERFLRPYRLGNLPSSEEGADIPPLFAVLESPVRS